MSGAALGGRAVPATGLLAGVVATAFFMEQMDSTVLVTALPAIAHDFGVSAVSGNLLLTVYLVSVTAFLPVSGRLADRFGTRAVFCAAIALFTLASILCSLAPDMRTLVGARLLQGVGGAMMSPVGRLLLLRSVPKTELVRAMSWVLMPTMIAPIAGPLVGGFFVTFASWRWIFWINVPVGLAGIMAAWLLIEADTRPDRQKAFDTLGALLCGLALSGIVVGLELLVQGGVYRTVAVVALAGGALSAFAYGIHARRHHAPVLDLSLLRILTFAVAAEAGMLFRIGIAAFPFLLPLMLQLGFGMSALHSGAITFASGISALLVKMTTVRILRCFGYRTVMVWNSMLSALFLLLCGAFRPAWPVAALYLVVLLGGFVRSLQFNALGTIAFADVPHDRMADATGLHSVIQQLAAVLGISIAAGALTISAWGRGAQELAFADFSLAFVVLALLACGSALLSLSLPPDAGHELSDQRAR